MKVFWSWQSDSPASTNKNFIKDALQAAVELISDDLGLSEAERPEIDHDTKNEPGLVEIVATIFKKIEVASVFVGDVTPIASTDAGKLVPNPNVMIELGHALKALGHEHIVLVTNRAFGGRPEDLPFDLRHRRGPIAYSLLPGATTTDKAKVKQQLTRDLADALKANLGAVLTKRDAGVEFLLHPSLEEDRSTWIQPGQGIEHQDFFNEAGTRSWSLAPGPRAYIRISPSSWSGKKPSRREVHGVNTELKLRPFGPWMNGDGGANDLGVVSVGVVEMNPGLVNSVTQWFEKTGEVWGFTTGITDVAGDGKTYIGQYRVLKDWATYLPKALAFFTHFGAQAPFRIEVGVEGLKNVHWAGEITERVRSLESSAIYVRQARDWGRNSQLAYLTDAYNELCDAFNRPRLSQDQVEKILPRIPE